MEIEAARPDGTRVPLQLFAGWSTGGSAEGCILAVVDASTAVAAAKLRAEMQHSLEFKVRVRTVELAEKIRERDEAHQKLNKTLSELVAAQKTLIQQEKMASLGGLVAGVAHEVNTPIGIGVTAVSYLSDCIRTFEDLYGSGGIKRSDLARFLDECKQTTTILEQNLSRAAELIRSFKQISVDQSQDSIREFSLLSIINDVVISVRPKYKTRPISIKINIDENMQITGNPGSVSQIIANLVMNSLIHGFRGSDEGQITIEGERVQGRVLLTYRDNGAGMTEDTVRQVFNPFFTTKRGAGGSGLGMHVVFNLVTQSLHGEISCESSPGDGVVFRLSFPVVSAGAEETVR